MDVAAAIRDGLELDFGRGHDLILIETEVPQPQGDQGHGALRLVKALSGAVPKGITFWIGSPPLPHSL